MPRFYITTAIPYLNAKPHIGFAMELVQADALARYYRLKLGDENVYFLTGSDEHGMKIYQTAKEEEKEPKAFVDGMVKHFQNLTSLFHVSHDDFIRTTEDRHIRGVLKIWNAWKQTGDLYLGTYQGRYCVGCEAYLLEQDLVQGKCPNHGKEPEYLEEKNYFFRYSKYLGAVIKKIESDELLVLPKSRKHEILNLLRNAEKEKTDVSFSRPASVLPWGISVPDDPSQTMYVWPDALTNYMTALGYERNSEKFQKFWPVAVHLIGKDILRFHAGLWPAMLLSARLPLPRAIYVHGFITSEGQKMSKSLGNVVDPFEVVEREGVDPVRWYLLREIPTGDDGDFSKSRFRIVYESELADTLGNLISRVLTMSQKYFEGKLHKGSFDKDIESFCDKTWKSYRHGFENFDIKKSCEAVLEFLTFLNKYVDFKKPWLLAKEKKLDPLAQVLKSLLEGIRQASLMLFPMIPQTAEKISHIFGLKISESVKKSSFGQGLQEGGSMKSISTLFPKNF